MLAILGGSGLTQLSTLTETRRISARFPSIASNHERIPCRNNNLQELYSLWVRDLLV